MLKPKYPFKAYTMVRNLINFKFSPDSSKIYYIDNTRGKYDLWVQDFPGSYPKQLTQADKWAIRNFHISPDAKTIFLDADTLGNENLQIFSLSSLGGVPKRLTKDLDKRYFMINQGYFSDSITILITTNSLGSGSSMDIASLNIDTGDLTQLTASDSNMFGIEVSPDNKKLLVHEMLGNTNSNLYLFDLENNELTLLTDHEGETLFNFQCWNPDSQGFYLNTNFGREFTNGAYYDLNKKSWEFIPELCPDSSYGGWNVGNIRISKDGKYLTWVINENGYGKLNIKNLSTNELLKPSWSQKGLVKDVKISPDFTKVIYAYESSQKVSDIHVFDLESHKEYILTQNMLGGIDIKDMILPELVQIRSFDNLMVPAWLFRPPNSKKDKVPIILSIHGGPESQERTEYRYRGLYQILLSLGIGVLAPNIRGSSGYGITYQKKIYRDWGGDELKDIEACAKYMQALPWVDSKRMGVYGGSFGGFATLSAITRLPDYWKLGVDLVGPSNLITFANSVPEFWKASGIIKKWVGDPVEDKEFLESRSPINYIDNIKADVLIGQGANDPRVVKAESDQIVEKLKKMGRFVKYIVYEDEGHGFVKTENYDDFLKSTIEFMVERFFDKKIDLSTGEF
ncbi:MAG: S9 family peptidase [Candidatus Hodarchaeales archaeon]|jgi:dipeptidyl aminopeptidase/acylaminoacyl peptidase